MKLFAALFKMWKLVLPLFAVLVVFAYLRFGGAEQTPAEPEAALQAEAMLVRLVCSDDCRHLAQCGTVESSGELVVLADSGQPRLTGHNMALAHDSLASVITSEFRQVRERRWVAEAPESPLQEMVMAVTFYLVLAEAQSEQPGRMGWVSGWCVQTP
jgi:hypothetical protein